MTFDRAAIGRRLRDERESRKLSQEALARLVDCSQRSVAEVERGGSFSARLLRDVASALGVTEGWLRTGKGPKLSGEKFKQEVTAALKEKPSNYKRAFDALLQFISDTKLAEMAKRMLDAKEFAAAKLLAEELERRKKG